jgi:hypothetical protein
MYGSWVRVPAGSHKVSVTADFSLVVRVSTDRMVTERAKKWAKVDRMCYHCDTNVLPK